MRILPFHVIPLFLSQTLPGSLGSQIRMFDVFYQSPPVVGWHVIGATDAGCDIVGFCAQGEELQDGVMGFSASEDSEPNKIVGFVVGDCDDNS